MHACVWSHVHVLMCWSCDRSRVLLFTCFNVSDEKKMIHWVFSLYRLAIKLQRLRRRSLKLPVRYKP